MGLRIQTNVNSLFAQRNLRMSTQRLGEGTEKLASGYRINKAADDAAGLAISEKMRAGVRSLNQAKRNAADGISLVQVAEGGLNEITNIVVRLKELAVQAASDTIGPKERGYLQEEFGSLKDEIDRIARTAEFNGTKLLVGPGEGVSVEELSNHNFAPLEIQVGKDYNPISDAIEARNPTNIIKIDLTKYSGLTEGFGSLNIGAVDNPDGTRVDTKQDAQMSMARLDEALDHISNFRATLGALQNRLGSTVRNLSNQVENMEAAKSRIVDTDYAEVTAQVTQQNILQQAGISVLAQANQFPKLALKLLE